MPERGLGARAIGRRRSLRGLEPLRVILQRIGGLSWTTETSLPRLALEVSELGGETVRYGLEAPSVPTTIRLRVDLPAQQLDAGPRDVLPHLIGFAVPERGRQKAQAPRPRRRIPPDSLASVRRLS